MGTFRSSAGSELSPVPICPEGPGAAALDRGAITFKGSQVQVQVQGSARPGSSSPQGTQDGGLQETLRGGAGGGPEGSHP